MTSDGAESAVVVRLPIPSALEHIRRRHDPVAGVGIPAHVTILYPFVDPAELVGGVRRQLATIAARHEPFRVRFERVGLWPDSSTSPLDVIAAEAAASLPFERPVTRLEVLVEGPDSRWRAHWRIPLGVRR